MNISLLNIDNILLKISLSFLLSLLISIFSIKKFISYKSTNFIQPIRGDGPQSHIINKKNTPTLGGIFIIISALLTTLIFTGFSNPYIIISLFLTISFAIIGLIDDLLKILYNNPKGFKGSYKMIIQFILVGLSIIWLGFNNISYLNNILYLPIFGGIEINLSIFYPLFLTFMMVGISNGVNLTDGLDGLVSMPAIINFITLIVIIFATYFNFSFGIFSSNNNYHNFLIKNHQILELSVFISAMIGSIAGFLFFNKKPAKIFMGDVGSLGIGASLVIIAIIIKQEFIFIIMTMLFTIEALSVIIQVSSYKIRKKRIFLMAPIHHHFEKKGWNELKIVKIFWLISLSFSLFSLLFI